MKVRVKLPAPLLLGTWSVNDPAKDQLEQLPEYAAKRAGELSAGTILKYVIAAVAEGLQKKESGWMVRCSIPEIKKSLGETGGDYSTTRAALVVSQNLLFRPINKNKAITTDRLVIGATTNPNETGSKSEVILQISEKYAKAIISPDQYIYVDLKELGSLRESGNIFLYLSFLRYSNIDIRFSKIDLAKLSARPNETPEARLAYYDNCKTTRGWSLLRRDTTSKIKNIEKNTSLRIKINKPNKDMVTLEIRKNYSRQEYTEEYLNFALSVSRLLQAEPAGVKGKLFLAYQKEGLAFIKNRFIWLSDNIPIREGKGGSLNGRYVGVGLMLNFISGEDVFDEFKKDSAKKAPAKAGLNKTAPRLSGEYEPVSELHWLRLETFIKNLPAEEANELIKKLTHSASNVLQYPGAKFISSFKQLCETDYQPVKHYVINNYLELSEK